MKKIITRVNTPVMNFVLKKPIPMVKKAHGWVISVPEFNIMISKVSEAEIMSCLGGEVLRLYRKLFILHKSSENADILKEKESFTSLVETNVRKSIKPPTVNTSSSAPPPPKEIEEVMEDAKVEYKVKKTSVKKKTPKPEIKKSPEKKPVAKKVATKKQEPEPKATKTTPSKKEVVKSKSTKKTSVKKTTKKKTK